MFRRSTCSRRRFRRCVVVAGAAGVVVAGGCTAWQRLDTATQSLTEPSYAGGALEVRTSNGSVEVRPADVSGLVVQATVRAAGSDRLERTRVVSQTLDGGGARILVEWADGRRQGNEGCSFVIQAPRHKADAAAGGGVKIDTSNGRVTVVGQSGRLSVDTSNGSIRVSDHVGPIDADTSNGRIEIERVRGDVRLDTSNGSITVADVVGAVVADTSNGGIVLRLARESTGPFNLDTSNGSVRVEVGPAFAGYVDASTSNRGIRITGARSLEGGRNRMTALFGPVGPERSGGASGDKAATAVPRSVIRTSNGEIDLVAVE